MENTDSYGLERIHALLLQVLLKFDEVCRNNGICYSLHGGTLLGAERHHAFIPWDDDVDVSMKRIEFERFQKAAQSLPSSFELDTHTMWVPRLVFRTDTVVVCVDIFVWDYVSSNIVAQKIKITLLRFFQGMMKTHIEYNRFGFINKLLLFVTHAVGKLVPQQTKLKMFSYLCQNALTGDKKCIHRSNDAFVGVSYIFDSTYMDDYSEIEFEGHSLMVNKRYHEFLARNYGPDYLTPPPMNQRKPEHENLRKDL